jgi:hypothetical protein
VCRTSSVIFLFDKIFQIQIPAKTEIKYFFENSKQEIEKAQTEIREKEKEKQAEKIK